MEGFWSSCAKWFNEKTSSPLYFTYLGFFVFWNWKFFQVIFLEHETLFITPRVEYITSELMFSVPLSYELSWAQSLVDWIVNTVYHVLPPAFFTFLAIKYLPWVHAWSFEIYLKNYFDRRDAYRQAELGSIREETATLKEKAKEKKQQQKQKTEIKRNQSQEEIWEEELSKFSEDAKNIDAMRLADKAAYERGGEYIASPRLVQNHGGNAVYIPADHVSRLDTKGLILISAGQYSSTRNMKFTEKGKFFLDLLRKDLKI